MYTREFVLVDTSITYLRFTLSVRDVTWRDVYSALTPQSVFYTDRNSMILDRVNWHKRCLSNKTRDSYSVYEQEFGSSWRWGNNYGAISLRKQWNGENLGQRFIEQKVSGVLVEEKRTSKPIKTTYTFVEDVSPRILKYDLNKQLIRRSHNKVPRQS